MLTQKIDLKSENFIAAMLWSLTIVIICCVMVLVYKSRFWGVQWDAAFFYYVSWLISEGAVPYRDFFDINLPGTYAICFFIFKVLGEGDIYWRIFDLFCLVVISALILLYCKPFGTLAGWIGVALFSAFHLYNGPMYIGQRDYIMLIFMLGALYCIALYVERCGSFVSLAISGGLLGFAVLIKPHVGILCVFLLCVIIVHALRSGRGWLWDSIVFTAFCCFFPAMAILMLWYLGALSAFFDIISNFGGNYSRIIFQSFSAKFVGVYKIEIAAVAVISLAGSIWVPEHRIRRFLLVVGMLYGLFHFYLQTRVYYQLYPFVLFMFMSIVAWVGCLRTRAQCLARFVVLVVLVQLCLVSLYRSATTLIESPPHHITVFGRKNMVVQDLSGKLAPGETVQLMDSLSGGIHALYDLHYRQPTRFLYDVMFFQNIGSPYTKKIRAEFLHDLQNRPPAYFVIFENSWPVIGYERLESFPRLQDWLYANYFLEIDPGLYRIYRKKD